MKSPLSDTRWSPTAWGLGLTATVVLLVGVAAPPFVGAGWAAAIHAGFGALCHQLPSRSFAVDGVPFAACHRCTGVYVGLVLGVLALPVVRHRAQTWARHDRWVLLAAVAPMVIDWSGDVLGVWTNTAVTRFGTGLWFGWLAGFVFARSIAIRRVVGEREHEARPAEA